MVSEFSTSKEGQGGLTSRQKERVWGKSRFRKSARRASRVACTTQCHRAQAILQLSDHSESPSHGRLSSQLTTSQASFRLHQYGLPIIMGQGGWDTTDVAQAVNVSSS